MANYSVVQSAAGDNGAGATTVSATWATATQRGSLLVAIIGYNTAGSDATITGLPSADWFVDVTNNSPVNVGLHLLICVPTFGAVHSGTETFTLSNSKKACVIIAEIAGVKPNFESDAHTGDRAQSGTGSSTGTSTTCGATSGSTTFLPAEVLAAGHAAQNVVTFSSPRSGWTIIAQRSSSGGGGGSTKVSVALLLGEITGIGSDPFAQTTLSGSQEWGALEHGLGGEPFDLATMGIGF
jgi:hypothetical protein